MNRIVILLFILIPLFGVAQNTSEETTEEISEDVVPEFPKFKGGEEALVKYLKENIKYPIQASEMKVEGTVYVIFEVNEEGEVINTMLAGEDLGSGLSQEALRVVESTSGMWQAGSIDGVPTTIKLRVPVVFKL